ncbi:MAG: hypothetical protein OXG69_04165 [bacterium]|nr:hypothetical protein [bacterium]
MTRIGGRRGVASSLLRADDQRLVGLGAVRPERLELPAVSYE